MERAYDIEEHPGGDRRRRMTGRQLMEGKWRGEAPTLAVTSGEASTSYRSRPSVIWEKEKRGWWQGVGDGGVHCWTADWTVEWREEPLEM